MHHPRHVVAFALVRDNGDISSSANFTALRRKGGRDFAFQCRHRVYRGGDRGDPFADLRAHVPDTALLIGEAPVSEPSRTHLGDEQFILTADPPADPSAPPVSPMILLRNCESRIQGLAEAFDIPMAALDDPVEQRVRRLADRAQALWLTWAITHIPPNEQHVAIAAFRAWRVIEDARPIGF